MQNEIKIPSKLFSETGDLLVKGYAKHNFFDYNKECLVTPKFKLKEWDYYYVGNEHYAVALTIADNGYMSLLSVSYLNFDSKEQITKSEMLTFPLGKTNHPRSTKIGDVSMQTKNAYLNFKNNGKIRELKGYFNNFASDNSKFEVDITLFDEPDESITMLTPFDKPHHFYYNQKINCIKAKGSFLYKGQVQRFNEKDSLATLDWGRGVWTYKNTWYWGSLSTLLDGKTFGFNIGYGFGNTTMASENIIFYDGKAHKFDDIDFGIPSRDGKDDFLSPWQMKTSDGRLDMIFIPLLDRASDTNVLIIRSNQHQVFGRYSGTAILDDGTKLTFKDKLGFAEKVFNKW